MSNALIKRLVTEEDAGTAVEYGLITAVIAVGLIVALTTFRNQISAWFSGIAEAITST